MWARDETDAKIRGEKMVKCSGCGSEMVCQADEMMNGNENMYACPVCKDGYHEYDENDPRFG